MWDSDSESDQSKSSSEEEATFDINDKAFDKLFETKNICEIDDNLLLEMKNQETADKDVESEMDDEKLITMLKTLPKRKTNPLSLNTSDVTSFVDLSTSKGARRKGKRKGKKHNLKNVYQEIINVHIHFYMLTLHNLLHNRTHASRNGGNLCNLQ